jgi:hypothetical protein
MSLLEAFGYFASILIALSIMMSNIRRLRLLNMLGAAAFSAYGYFIDAYPVFILNGWVAIVNAYYLIRIFYVQDKFDLIRLQSIHTPLFSLLKEQYGEDVRELCRGFQWQQLDNAVVLLIFRNMKPVGFFAYQALDTQGKAEVLLDYIIPEDRDFKAAQFLFTKHNSQLSQEGIKHLVVQASDKAHEHYLNRIGFSQVDNRFELQLS